jgi:hypothetical protein
VVLPTDLKYTEESGKRVIETERGKREGNEKRGPKKERTE